MDLETVLNNRKCFKLVCGSGNENLSEVEKLVAVYARAGANYFDLSARPDVVIAAKKAIEHVIPYNQQSNYFLNVSVGISGDPHVRKSFIDTEKCEMCGECENVCPQYAIKYYSVIHICCIGCGKCETVCRSNAIRFNTENKCMDDVLPPLIDLGINSIELHAITDDEDEAFKKWCAINNHFKGILSLCLDRSHLGDIQLINRIKRFISLRKDFSVIIQCDGAPMSGGDDNLNTTLQTIATADIVQKANLPVWLLLSGGTNSRTTEMAKKFGIKVHGVAIGSYARKILREYTKKENLLTDEKEFDKACAIAKNLVDKSFKYL